MASGIQSKVWIGNMGIRPCGNDDFILSREGLLGREEFKAATCGRPKKMVFYS